MKLEINTQTADLEDALELLNAAAQVMARFEGFAINKHDLSDALSTLHNTVIDDLKLFIKLDGEEA